MPDSPLHANSLAEAYLYLKVTTCSICRHGATDVSDPQDRADGVVRLIATCRNCGGSDEYLFDIGDRSTAAGDPRGFNPTGKRSKLIDVAQWLTLYHLKTEAAASEKDKTVARSLCIQAAQCVDEALKFYTDDNDIPPDDAFFSQQSRDLFKQYPERFTRQRLIDLSAKMPKVEQRGAANAKQKPWWRFW